MARSSHSMLGYVRAWLADAKPGAGSDGALLRRFVQRRDDTAFAELLDRHGPMILGLCRRLIGDSHLAEDVFQASFLVLARKARSIRRPDSIGAWLYGVAHRLALKARAKHRRLEPQPLPERPAAGPDPLEDISARELLAIVDTELLELPEVYRLPLIHCCLEGRSLEETAQLLGWSTGSVKGRLERGRSRLRDRLARHGLTLPAVLGPALFLAPPLVATPIMQSTLPLARGAVDLPHVTALAEEGIRALFTAKSKAFTYGSLAASLLGIGIGLSVWAVTYASKPTYKENQNTEIVALVRQLPAPDGNAQANNQAHPLPAGALMRLGTTQHRHPLAKTVLFHPDGTVVNTAGEDGMVRTWEVVTGNLLAEHARPGEHKLDSSLSQDGKLLMRINGNRVEFWRPGSLAMITAHDFNDLKKAVLAPDGRSFATVEGAGASNVLQVHTLEPFSSRPMGRLASFPGEIAIAPDSRRVFTSLSLDGMIRCWDGRQDGPAWSTRIAAAKIVVSANGQCLIVNPERRDGRFVLLDVITGKPLDIPPLPVAGAFWNATLSPDGTHFCCAGDKGVLIWDVREGKPVFQIPGEAHDAAFSPDGRTLAAVSGGIHVYEVATGKLVFDAAIDHGHTTPIRGITWSPDGRRILSHAMPGRNDVLLWDVANPIPKRINGAFRTLARAEFSRDGKHATTLAFDGQTSLANTETAKEVGHRTLVDASDRAFEVALSRDGRQAVFLFDRGEHKLVPEVVWIHPATGETERTISLPDNFGRKVMMSTDGRALYTPRGEQFDSEWQRVLPPLQVPAGRALDEKAVLSNSGDLIAIPLITNGDGNPSRDGVAVWERATGQLLRVVPSRAMLGTVALSPDGGIVAVGELNRVILWEVATGKELARLDLPPRPKSIGDDWFFDAVSFSPDGQRIATGHFDSTILIWDVPQREVPRLTIAEAWDCLGAESGVAMRAMEWLTANRTDALRLLRGRISPSAPMDSATIRQLLADLHSQQTTMRDAASNKLASLGDAIVPLVREAQKCDLPVESIRRIRELLRMFDTATPPVGERLRTLRALVLLERIGTVEAIQLLESVSRGDPAARTTREAKAALERLVASF